MQHDLSLPASKTRNVWAPFAVVYPWENPVEAAERHRRETGHKGGVIIVGINAGGSAVAGA